MIASFSALGVDFPSIALIVLHSTVSVPVCLFRVDAGTMLYRVDSDVHLQTNEDW